MNRAEFLKSIPSLERAYLIHSDYTRCPYIVCDPESFDDTVLFFTEKEAGEKEVQSLQEKKDKVSLVEITQEKLPSAIAGLVLFGVNAVNIQSREERYLYQIEEIVKIPARENKEAPLFENPNLAITMAYFMQELRKNDPDSDKQKLRELEEEMIVNMMRAKYLLPVSKVAEDATDKNPALLLMNTPDGKSMIPLFTDHVEFGRFRQDLEVDLKILDFPKILELDLPENSRGYIVNPAGIGVLMTVEWLKHVKENTVVTPKEESPESR